MWEVYIYQSVYSIHTVHIHIYTYICIYTNYVQTCINTYIHVDIHRNIQPSHKTSCVDHVAINAEIWHNL